MMAHCHQSLNSTVSIGASKRKLTIAAILCAIFMAAEVVGGVWSGSLAILTDAAHLLADLAGFLISLVAITLARRPASLRMSYGYHRAEILGALGSLGLVWLMTGWLVVEALGRLSDPPPIDGRLMSGIATLGVLVNGLMMRVLCDSHGGSYHQISEDQSEPHVHSLNVSAAYIHVLGDMIQSVGVLVASLLIWWKPSWRILDPFCTLGASGLVLASTAILTKECVLVLMEATPVQVDTAGVSRDLAEVEGVRGVHDLHVWALSPGKYAGTTHLTVDVGSVEEVSRVLKECQRVVCVNHQIHHMTIQLEPSNYVCVEHRC